jgi:hypothetical protein
MGKGEKFGIKIRRLWKINPWTRIKESQKKYSRKKMKKETEETVGEPTEEEGNRTK